LDTEPTIDWYLDVSRRRKVTPRCPHASVERCPRYYQSLSLLQAAGFTEIEPEENARLLDSWKKTDLWPRLLEDSTSVGRGGDSFSYFCPEVSHQIHGYFASDYGRDADDIDRESRYRMLKAKGVARDSWRWSWAYLRPLHFTECSLYSPLTHGGPSRSISDYSQQKKGRGTSMDSKTSQSRALRLLKQIYDHTRGGTEPIFVSEIAHDADLTEDEANAAWNHLKERGLIKTFSIPYTALINDAGVRAIEDAQKDPTVPSSAFPSVTYNIVNIGTANNSPMQIAGAHSSQEQTTSYSSQDTAELARLVHELGGRLPELNLSERDNQKAKASLATLEAQLADDPDPVIVRRAGRTLRNITEGVIAGLITAGVQPAIWAGIMDIMSRMF
jgi:hypothetical protein